MKLSDIRRQNDETQYQLAKTLNVSISTIQKIETDRRKASDGLKIKIAMHYGVTVGYLFFGEPITNSNKEAPQNANGQK